MSTVDRVCLVARLPLARPTAVPILFNRPLGDQYYLRTYWTDLHQIFRIGTRGGYDQSDLFFAVVVETLLW